MPPVPTARRGPRPLVDAFAAFCALGAGSAAAQEPLAELVARIPEVADDEPGIGAEEEALALAIKAYGKAAIPALLPLLESDDAAVLDLAGFALRDVDGLREAHLDALIAAQRREDGWLPIAIARIGTPRAIGFLVDELEAQPRMGQVTAALELVGAPAAVELARRFASPRALSDDFAYQASGVMHRLGERAAVAAGELLAVATSSECEPANRRLALLVLASVGPLPPSAARALVALVESEPALAEAAEVALIASGGPEATHVVLRILRTVPGELLVRDVAAAGPANVGAGPGLLDLLAHDDADLRVAAARALGDVGCLDAAPALAAEMVQTDDWMLAYAAAESVGRLGARELAPELERVAAGHWYPPVRDAAHRALAAVGGGEAYGPRETLGLSGSAFFEYPVYPDGEVRVPAPPETVASPGALSASDLRDLAYRADIVSFGEDGSWRTSPIEQRPDCGLRVEDGVLLGASRGEWGGELVHVDPSGAQTKVLDDNVLALHRTPDGVVAVAGLGHLGIVRGALYRVERREGRYSAARWKRLPGPPSLSGLLADGSVWVRCPRGDVVVGRDGRMTFAEAR